jgi:hypothetical protein
MRNVAMSILQSAQLIRHSFGDAGVKQKRFNFVKKV